MTQAPLIVIAFLVASLLSAPPGLAYSDISFEHLSLEHGLAQSAVQDMVSDELGYMWFGTQYGLSRYDGYGFRNFRHVPGDPSSLSNSRIQHLLKGRDGWVWVGTRSGLNRLDPETLRIERITVEAPAGAEDPEPFPQIREMVEGRGGDLLIETASGPLHYEYRTGRLRRLNPSREAVIRSGGTVAADAAGRLWWYNVDGLWRLETDEPRLRRVLEVEVDDVAVRRGSMVVMASGLLALASRNGVTLFDPQRESVVERIEPSELGHDANRVASLAADPRGMLWVLGRDYLTEYDPETGQWHVRLERWKYGAAESQRMYDLSAMRDERGYVWIGLPEGIGLSPPDGGDFRLLQHDPKDPDSLTASPWSSAYSVYQDRFGVVWLGGGLGGLSRFSPHQTRFEHIIDERANRLFGTDNVIRSVLEVEHGDGLDLWTGLSFSGIRVWRRDSGGFKRIVAELNTLADDSYRLSDNRVWALSRHPQTGDVWAGTSNGLVAISPSNFAVLRDVPVRADGRPVRIKSIVFSEDGRELWAAGGKRLMRFELGPGGREVVGREMRSAAPQTVSDNEHGIFNMLRLANGGLLVATRRGLVLWNPGADEITHEYPAGRAGELPRNFVFGLAQAENGDLWIGTELSGMARSRLVDGGFAEWEWFDTTDGLPDDTVYAILPTPEGRLWLSSNRGLARFNPGTGIVRHFTLSDGLQALEFNNTVADIGESGRFYFGGINGVNAFRPEAIRLDDRPPRVLLQQAIVGEESVSVDASSTVRLSVPHDRNALLAEFVGLHFVDPERNRYAYRLSGIDADWIDSPAARRVRYPDLPPGDYALTVKAANSDGVWSEPRQLLSLTVGSPPWLTPWAFSIYLSVAALLIGLFLMAERRRRRSLEQEVVQRTRELQERNELVDRQARALEESLDTRTTLFANISHEFRTPLTLIEASIDRLSRNPGDSSATASARRYLRRLLRLVDQLLNLSRLQSAREQTLPDPWPLDRVVAMTVDAFRPLAEQKGIDLTLESDGRWLTQCQQADVERILLNLIGNALKYCPRGCRVRVAVKDDEKGLVISVIDDGPGIEPARQEQIFERFNRMPAHEHGRIEGAGIGLTLVREAARSNGGHASVESEQGQGAAFRVWLPGWRGHMQGAPVDQLARQRLELELETLAAHQSVENETGEDGLPDEADGIERLGTALVVEDNQDLLAHLTDSLAGDWRVLTAGDGGEGLRMARERLPDVVVSDIMMPGMDGLELLKRIREDVRTSHLPVLLLTARHDDATRLQGFSLSADDFLAKPFNTEELRLRLRRMIDSRSRVQARLWRQMETSGQPAESAAEAVPGDGVPDLSDRDRQLLDRIRHWLAANHDDPEAGVGDLADFLAMEQRTLQRKLKSLTGKTPAEHLQHYRLERARRLLAGTDRPVQDVAYSCGFSSPQYFSRVFTRQEGATPTQWRERGKT